MYGLLLQKPLHTQQTDNQEPIEQIKKTFVSVDKEETVTNSSLDNIIFKANLSIWFLASLGLPNSLIYAGIWPHAIRDLGRFTKMGASLLVMALCGNAILPLIYGKLADITSLQKGYWVLIPCFIYLI